MRLRPQAAWGLGGESGSLYKEAFLVRDALSSALWLRLMVVVERSGVAKGGGGALTRRWVAVSSAVL